ncbi:lysylphosphatidylglycerol synthase domain-containing protein [Pseudotamlana haliotis]|uniref:lysylphosphatidylglycerol synthase domain-containing protein n=1 Tax=Pseudotamlana haliotis TaxID=2614804 RepID=UPI001CD963A4|nr:lysylphosphatidylglycerol synthase domain-containing protein [Tamlana haliotis]
MLIKISIVIAALYFIYQKLINNNTLHFSDFYIILTENSSFSVKIVSFLIFLSAFNWFLEILKWQTLVAPFKKLALRTATEQTLGALTASLMTPNRIGEYGAKAMYYQSSFQKKIVFINLISNLLQLLATLFFGVIGLFFFIKSYNTNLNLFRLSLYGVGLFAIILLGGYILIKGNFRYKNFSLEKIRQFLIAYPKDKLFFGCCLSFFRYAVFSFQFYFLLLIFQINLSYFEALSIIASMYLLASIVPSIFIFDVFIKGGIAVYLFSFAHVNELHILSIITLMWLLNFVIPSLLGSYYVLKFDLKNRIT